MKKLLCLLLLLTLLPVLPVLAETGPLYTAISKISAPIYAEMDKESAQVGRFNPGVAIDVYAIYPEWLEIGMDNGTGYIPRHYLYAGKAIDKENTPPWGVVFYQYVGSAGENGADILSAPQAGSETLIHLDPGTRVSVMDLESGWARVVYYRQYGYIDTNLLSELLPVCSNTEAATERAPIATFTSYYITDSEDESVSGKETNIGVNCADMNGLILAAGEYMDYDVQFGPYGPLKNYVKGPVLLEGGWGLGPGGGVCQVSSTLYNVLLQLPGINIVHAQPHGPSGVAYLPVDMDAAVGNAAHSVDMMFRNEYDFPIRLEALAQHGALFIAIYRVTEQ